MGPGRDRLGSGDAAPDIVRLLSLAAAPVVALMALWTGAFGGPADMLCTYLGGGSPMDGMAMMYALMSLFHAGPWLRLIQRG
nr:hypothetical protein [Pseudolabrys sp. FHR47]